MAANAYDRSTIARNTGLAIVIAVIANLALYLIARAADWIPEDLPDGAEQFGLFSIVLATALPIAVGGVIFALVNEWTRDPLRMFFLISSIGFIISLLAPLTLPATSTGFRVLLVLMHIVAAVIAIAIIPRPSRSS